MYTNRNSLVAGSNPAGPTTHFHPENHDEHGSFENRPGSIASGVQPGTTSPGNVLHEDGIPDPQNRFWKGFEPTEVGLPMPVERKACTVPDAASFARLKEIEAYAGAVNTGTRPFAVVAPVTGPRTRSSGTAAWSTCCALDPTARSVSVARGPHALPRCSQHRLLPEWLAELVEEFNSAYKEGHWL